MANGRLGLRTRPGLIRSLTEITSGDPDANAFIYAAGLTDATQKNAINQLVVDLKAYGIWSKMKAIYPMVGGTADTHKWNLKDARDTDNAFRLSFLGGWTHSSTGAKPNGTNAYADTFLTPSTSLSTSSSHFSKYNRDNDLSGNKIDGTIDNPNFFQQNYSAGNGIIGDLASIVTYTQTDTKGLFTITRTSNNVVKVFKNNLQQGSTNTTTTSTLPAFKVYLGARNDNNTASFFNSYECAFATIGDGLTDTEVSDLYTAVNDFQTTLSRNV